MTQPKDKKVDSSKVVVDTNPKKFQGIQPVKGVQQAIHGLEFRTRMIEFERKKIQQLIFKAKRAGESGNIEEMTKVTDEITERNDKLSKLEKDFADRCNELGLVPTAIKPT